MQLLLMCSHIVVGNATTKSNARTSLTCCGPCPWLIWPTTEPAFHVWISRRKVMMTLVTWWLWWRLWRRPGRGGGAGVWPRREWESAKPSSPPSTNQSEGSPASSALQKWQTMLHTVLSHVRQTLTSFREALSSSVAKISPSQSSQSILSRMSRRC